MFRNFLIFVVVAAVFVFGGAKAQTPSPDSSNDISIRAFFTKDSILIGDQLFLRVIVDKDVMTATEFPSFENGFGGKIEILGAGDVDTIKKEGRRVSIKRDYLVTSFDAGHYNIGKFPMLRMDKNLVDTLYSQDSIYLYVDTFVIDSTKHKIVDITSPLDTPLVFDEVKDTIFIVLLALILLSSLVYAIIKYRKNRASKYVDPKTLIPPHQLAMEELQKIYSLKLWNEGKQKIYYSKISDILREYLEGRFGYSAMEKTTDEIISDISKTGISQREQSELNDILSLADLVKFAKFAPDQTECETSYNMAQKFVERTRPVELEQPAEQPTKQKESSDEN